MVESVAMESLMFSDNGNGRKERNHKRFRNHLDDSREIVWLVAAYLNKLGYEIRIPKEKKAEQYDERMDYVDDGDLIIDSPILYGSISVECKGLGVLFSGRNDWPYKNKFIVCAKHSFDNAKPKPLGYMIVSNDKKCVALVMSETKNDWYVEKRVDARYEGNYEQEYYFAPMRHVKFLRIE